MKLNQIAIAATMAAAAISAHATLPATLADGTTVVSANVDAANTNGRVIFLAGASAVQKGFDTLISNLLNTPVYFNNDGKTALNASGYMAVVGTLKAASGTWPAGSAVIVQYRNSGGSIYGVNSVARGTAIKALTVTTATCGATATGLGTLAKPFDCSFATAVPDAGVSDVNPKLFQAPYNLEGETGAVEPQLTTAEISKLKINNLYAQAFGLPVTNTVTPTAVLNRATVTAIMTGAINSWSQVATDGTDAAFPANAGSGTNDNIVICRRIPGSGSQSVMNLWSAGFPCSSTAGAPADRGSNAAGVFTGTSYVVANAPAGSTVVIENNASGDVRKCLDAAVNGGSYTTTDRASNLSVTVDFGAGGYKAIGVLSLDSLASSLATPIPGVQDPVTLITPPPTGQWQYRALNGTGMITGDGLSVTQGPSTTAVVATPTGVLPTMGNLLTGNWDMQGWTTMQYVSAAYTSSLGNAVAAITTPKKAFVTSMITEAQNLTTLQAAKELKYTAAIIPTGTNAGVQTLHSGYALGNQCAPLARSY